MLFTDEARSVNMSTGSVYRGLKEFNSFGVWGVRAGQTGSLDTSYPANIWQTGQWACYDQAGSFINCAGTGQDGDIQAGVAWPTTRFTDNGNETVTDNLTGLIWAKDADLPEAVMSFANALAYIQGMNDGIYPNFGYVNWRLPNRKELLSLVDFSQNNPVLPAGFPFQNVQTDFYWSSTVSSSTPDAAWTISMEEGFMLSYYFSGEYRVWPVMGGSFACAISAAPNAMLESNQTDAELGTSVSYAGDVNGDGYDDVIVGAPLYNNGAAFIYLGGASGISTDAPTFLESDYLGYSVSGAGDVNGDGYDDVIVGAPRYENAEAREGAAFIYHGSVSGISTVPAVILESNQAGAMLGSSVSGAGDVNGDGFDDVIVGASLYSNGELFEGAAYVYLGSVSGISTIPAVILESNQAGAMLGSSVSGAGDVNDDGWDDVIVGAPQYDDTETDEGVAFVYHGSVSGISAPPDAILGSNQAGAMLGRSVSGAGDVNNDGFDDIITGAYDYTAPSGGQAYVYHGSASGVLTIPSVTIESKISYRRIANSVSGAGDVNGDGFDDILIGAKDYLDSTHIGVAFVYLGGASGISDYPGAKVQSDQSAEFGISVSGAGDVNDDGFADVIVGARNYDNGEMDEGATFIYHGNGCNLIDGLQCEGDFDSDGDVDGSDLAVFAADFGRTDCASPPPFEGDFDSDDDVDGSDLATFAADFGRTDCPNI